MEGLGSRCRVPGKGLAGVLLLAAIAGCSALASAYGPAAVNSERMRSADSKENVGEWMCYGRTYDEQRFSPLEQINDGNVDQLGLAWFDDLRDLARDRGHAAGDRRGALQHSALNIVTAYRGATARNCGPTIPKSNKEWARLACCGPSARGIAAWNGKIYVGALDGRLIAVDAKTGKEVWTTRTFDPRTGPIRSPARRAYSTARCVIGNGGADYGVRGFVSAYDAETGKKLWKFYIVPGNPADGPDGEASDSAMKMATPRPGPANGGRRRRRNSVGLARLRSRAQPRLHRHGQRRPARATRSAHPAAGDNLFLCSIVALDADTGEYVWHYQMVPGEIWDFTCTQPMMLADLQIDGQAAPGAHAGAEERLLLCARPQDGRTALGRRPTCPNTWATHDRHEDRPAGGEPEDSAPDLRADADDAGATRFAFVASDGLQPQNGPRLFPCARAVDGHGESPGEGFQAASIGATIPASTG